MVDRNSDTPTSLTQGLGHFVATPGFPEAPDDLAPLIRNGIIDTLACLLAGRHETVTQSALQVATRRASTPEASVLLGRQRLCAQDAAFVNAVAAHALDYDDMALNGHPSVVLVCALLSACEAAGATDAALLRSYLVGYEVWAELDRREPDSMHNKGWHPTSVIGTVAAAAAVAHLEKLGPTQAAHALGIAASMASGLMGNFGSMTKPLHAGWAASHGNPFCARSYPASAHRNGYSRQVSGMCRFFRTPRRRSFAFKAARPAGARQCIAQHLPEGLARRPPARSLLSFHRRLRRFPMKICIYGLGAIGGLFAARLAASGVNVSAIARGATLDVVNRDGITLLERVDGSERRRRFPLNATSDPATLGEQDLVIVTVKTTALQSVARDAAPLLGANTAVLSAMNGIPWWFFYGLKHDTETMQLQSIDPTGEISAAIAPERIVGCVTHLAATAPAPGVVNDMAGNRLIIGEPAGGAVSARCAAIIALFRQAGFEVEEAASIQRDIWFKLWGNMTVNPISAMTGATIDRILDDTCVRDFMTRCMVEAARIGKRIGVPIDIDPVVRHEVTRKLGAFKTSMLQDVEAGKPVELNALVGAVLEIAQRVREPSPNIEALFGLARLHAKMHNLY